MTIRMTDPFSFTVHKRATASVDPDGRPDSRWHNGQPETYRTSIEIEFEKEDVNQLREIVHSLGGYFPGGDA